MEENHEQIQTKQVEENHEKQFSDEEQKEKVLLDYYYHLNQIETEIDDKILQKKFKKSITEVGKMLSKVINKTVTKKDIKNYIFLKNSNFDPNYLKLTKYIENENKT